MIHRFPSCFIIILQTKSVRTASERKGREGIKTMQKEGKKQAKDGSENKTDLEGFEPSENELQVCKT